MYEIKLWMKKYLKPLFFVFTLTALIISPNFHINAIETTNSKMMKDDMAKQLMSPHKQMKMGVDVHKIQCGSNYQLVFKSTNWSPSCVKSSSVSRLIEIGWASAHNTTHNTNEMPNNMKLMVNATNTININVKEIDGVYRWSNDDGINPPLTIWANADNIIKINNPTDEKHEFVIESQTQEVTASGDVIPDGEISMTFKPNMMDTLDYHCEYHPETMKGEIKIISP